jgi:ferredoxin
MRVAIDTAKCQGHGQCVMTCPDVFSADEQGFAVVEQPEVPASLVEKVERAALRCPERAVRIERA